VWEHWTDHLLTRKLPANVLKPPYLLWREVLNSHWLRQVSMECAPFFLEYFSQWRQQHCTVLDNFYQGASLDFCIALLNLTTKSKLFLYIHFTSILNSLVRNLVQSIHQWTHGYKTNCLDSQVHISTMVFGEKFNQSGARGWWDSKTRLTSSRRPHNVVWCPQACGCSANLEQGMMRLQN